MKILMLAFAVFAASASARDFVFQKTAYFQAPAGQAILEQTTTSLQADGLEACQQKYAVCQFERYALVKLETFHQSQPAILATFEFHYSAN